MSVQPYLVGDLKCGLIMLAWQTLKSQSFFSALDYAENLLAGLNFATGVDITSP